MSNKPLTGVWDQWCVMSARPYVKMVMTDQGEEVEQTSLLNLDTCRKIVLNFGLSKDNLPCTLGHQPNTVEKAQYKTATYSAMAVWHQRQVVEFAAHGEVERPTLADLPRADNGQAPEDGIYCYRNTVTELGAAILEKQAVRKTSPEFVMDALNQQAQSIGPQALGLAWTDDPFLNGCEINLERFPQMRKYTTMQHRWDSLRQRKGMEMNRLQDLRNEEVALVADLRDAQRNADDAARRGDSANSAAWGQKAQQFRTRIDRVLQDIRREENMKTYEAEAGVEEKDSPEQKYGKIKAHFGRKAMMEAGIADADTPDVAMAKFAKHMEAGDASATGSQQHKEPDKDNLMEGPSAIKGAPTEIDPGSVSDKVVGGHAMERETVRAMSEQIKQDRAKIQAMQGQLAVMERAQKKEAATKAVDTAWQSGRIVPLPGESADKAKARFLVKYEKDPAMFADDLAPVGTHAVAGSLSDVRLTSNGLPVNFERGTFSEEASRPDDEIIRRAEELRAKQPKLSKLAAVKQICMESPELNRAYSTQSRRAAMGLG